MGGDIITLRPATRADTEALAALIIQLYHTEAPGVLRGAPAGQIRFFQAILAYELASGIRDRYVAANSAGEIVGSASLRILGNPSGGLLPPGILGLSLRELGLGNMLRLFSNALRASLLPETPIYPGQAYIYSVVVDELQRQRGIGTRLIGLIEQEIRRIGLRTALLRVIIGNENARRLYVKLGYQSIARTPRMLDWVSSPSELMRKELN